MKNILILGAGMSTRTLISYLLNNAKENNWRVIVADANKLLAKEAILNSEFGHAISLDIFNEQNREKQIMESEIVVSMLPPSMHHIIAKDCIRYKKNLVTASYVSKEMSLLDNDAKNAGILILNEIGLDPGIDHMSAMKIINQIKEQGGNILSFKSFCGGLVHPDHDDNPWNYKFTWNPRNVVLAGQGTAQYKKNGKYKYIPYSRLFERIEFMNILDAGEFEGYANRDSLSYIKSYGIEDIDTMLRGTLRKKGFCKSWNIFVKLGMTEDSYLIKDSDHMTCREYTNLFFPYNNKLTVEEKFCNYLNLSIDSDEFRKFSWLGLFSKKNIQIEEATPARILQKILEDKWRLNPTEKDMVVMQHQFEYQIKNSFKKLNSSLLVYGDNQIDTAMAKTVGLPVAIAVKLILNGVIKSRGVKIPVSKDIYNPVLNELSDNGINFIEEHL